MRMSATWSLANSISVSVSSVPCNARSIRMLAPVMSLRRADCSLMMRAYSSMGAAVPIGTPSVSTEMYPTPPALSSHPSWRNASERVIKSIWRFASAMVNIVFNVKR